MQFFENFRNFIIQYFTDFQKYFTNSVYPSKYFNDFRERYTREIHTRGQLPIGLKKISNNKMIYLKKKKITENLFLF